ncbi:MAG TPA: DoxX family protein [Gemmatimonadales bacterium]
MSSLLPLPSRLNAALAVLRAAVGVIFVAHGAQKLFVFGPAAVGGAFGQMGIPAAGVVGPLIGTVEFLGGLALIAGLLTRVASVGLALVMLGAISMVHISAGFFMPEGIEFALSLLAATTALALAGPGAYSLDAVLARRGSAAGPLSGRLVERRKAA